MRTGLVGAAGGVLFWALHFVSGVRKGLDLSRARTSGNVRDWDWCRGMEGMGGMGGMAQRWGFDLLALKIVRIARVSNRKREFSSFSAQIAPFQMPYISSRESEKGGEDERESERNSIRL